jgi:hypothetical protein
MRVLTNGWQFFTCTSGESLIKVKRFPGQHQLRFLLHCSQFLGHAARPVRPQRRQNQLGLGAATHWNAGGLLVQRFVARRKAVAEGMQDPEIDLIGAVRIRRVALTPLSHPRRTTYILKGPSQFAYSYADGKTETIIQQAGVVSSRERERMSVTNVGVNEVVVLVVIDKRDVPAL